MELDLVLTGARALTLDAARPTAHAIGILGGRIVGFDDEIDSVRARRTVDVDGAAVLPGFHDVHCHTAWFGLTLASADVERLPGGLPEVYDVLARAAREAGPGEWVVATGYAHRDYDDAYPDIAVLDRIADGRPLVVRQVSGHAAIANTRTLELAGVFDPGFAEPVGGRIVRDAHGRPTGLVEETAQQLVQDLIRPYSTDTLVHALDLATARYAQEGITSFGEAGIAGGWIGHSPVEVASYQRARAEGRLRARAQLMPSIEALHPVGAHAADDVGLGLDLGMLTGFGDDEISIGPVKIFLDGALSGETAALRTDYTGKDHAGYLQADPEELRRLTLEAYRTGWSVAVHAIGDRAVDLAVATITEAIDAYGARPVPNRIEHAAMMADEHLPVLARYGIAVTPQAAFFDGLGDAMVRSIGPEREPLLYRGRSFLDAGVLMPGSSDRPCADGDVLRGIQAYMDRRSRSGRRIGPESELLTAEQAVRAYTSVAAEASGQLASKGTLSTGKLADLVVLGASPLEADPSDIAGIEVRATIRGGEFTHSVL